MHPSSKESVQGQSRFPLRMCFVCRKTCPKPRLLRFTFVAPSLTFDESFKAGGRGVYVHPECTEAAGKTKMKRWEHVLRLKPGSLSPLQVSDLMDSKVDKVKKVR